MSPRLLPLLLGPLLLAACDGSDEDSSKAPPINQNDDSGDPVCEGTAPVITELVVENYGGLYPFETGDAAALQVSATGTDADADLHRMNLVLWWDDVVDGSVDTSGAGTEAGYYRFEDTEPCAGDEATLGLIFEVGDARFQNATPYEFAAVIWDDAGLVSEVAVADGVAPNADGTDG